MAAEVRMEVATLEHAAELAPRMRAADWAECQATGYASPLDALEDSLGNSSEAWALTFDGQVGALWGVVDLGRGRGGVWALTGELVERHRKDFLRASVVAVRHVLESYSELWNGVDARYVRALRWARWLGFDVLAPVHVGGLPFHPIVLRRSAWAAQQ